VWQGRTSFADLVVENLLEPDDFPSNKELALTNRAGGEYHMLAKVIVVPRLCDFAISDKRLFPGRGALFRHIAARAAK
jgi:hypothetical protein